MEHSTLWWLLTGAAVGIELATGTFYLLMLAIGLAAAALAAHAGAAFEVQIAFAAVVGSAAVLGWRAFKRSRTPDLPASANHDVNLDIGETVQVDTWNPNRTAQVKYRGANWTVASVENEPLVPGEHQVVEVIGSRLIVQKR